MRIQTIILSIYAHLLIASAQYAIDVSEGGKRECEKIEWQMRNGVDMSAV